MRRLNPISGLFNLNKPPNVTSHDVVARVRRLLGQRKVGHAGTLDPLATGVLLVCVGQATRLIEYLVVGQKQYRATIRFGVSTTTYDAEGDITQQTDVTQLTKSTLKTALPQFIGTIQQIPPIYSAIKQDGKPLYKKARAGETIAVRPRSVTIDTLNWIEWQPPDLTLDITCSPGTYIRSIAHDLGNIVGTGAYLQSLNRTGSGQFSINNAVTLEQLEVDYQPYLQPLSSIVAHLPKIILTQQETTAISQGKRIPLTAIQPNHNGILCAYTPNHQFLAILTQADDPATSIWQPKKVFQVV